MMNYDPNLTLCGRMAKQKVKLTFARWEYRTTIETEVRGNCTGLSVIDCACGRIYDELPVRQDKWKTPFLILTDPSGGNLEDEDEEEEGDDWLKNMLIAAEIVSIEPANEG